MIPENAQPTNFGDEYDASMTSSWFISYLDTITILLIFFVMLLANSTLDVRKILVSKEASVKQAGGSDDSTGQVAGVVFPVNALNSRLLSLFGDDIVNNGLELQSGDYETRLVFSGSSFFNLGEAELLPEGRSIVQRIVQVLARIENQDFKIDVEGHTDSAPIETSRFKTNWELSSARAAVVVRYFLEEGTQASKLKASGYADTFKLVEDQNEQGVYLPEQQSKNRRIVIRLYYD